MKYLVSLSIFLCSIMTWGQKAVSYDPLNESIDGKPICSDLAVQINQHFVEADYIDWTDRKNNCEDRANAVSTILDRWSISNGKAWCFGGKIAKYGAKTGKLDGWTYHVAACINVDVEGEIKTMVIDPLTSKKIVSIEEWAEMISAKTENIFFVTKNDKYQQNSVSLSPTWKESSENFDETIKGLTRYNSFSWNQRRKTKKYLNERLLSVAQGFFKDYYTVPEFVNDTNCN